MIRSVLIAGQFAQPLLESAFADELERLGLSVNRFAFKRFLGGRAKAARIALGASPALFALNWFLRAAVRQHRPDVVLLWTALPVWPSTVQAMLRRSWVASYTNDDPFGTRGTGLFWRHFRAWLPLVSSHHVYRAPNLLEFSAAGAQHVALLPSYFVPGVHFRDSTAAESFRYGVPDAVFIGTGEPLRVAAINHLARRGVRVAVYGRIDSWSGLPLHPSVTLRPLASPTEYRRIVSGAPVTLGFLSRQNRDDYTRRYFEVPACGGCLVAERTTFAETLFVSGKEMLFYSTLDELYARVTQVLCSNDARNRLADAARVRCTQSRYDVGSRASQWLSDTQSFMRTAERKP